MPTIPAENWSERIERVLSQYDEPLLRQVAQNLIRPRSEWPVEELRERLKNALGNVAILDRRLKELPAEARQLLRLIAQSRQNTWSAGNLVEMLLMLGHAGELAPVLMLLEFGLLFPDVSPQSGKLRSFEQWLVLATPVPWIWAPPLVVNRCLSEPLPLPTVAVEEISSPVVLEADGMEWLLRVAVLLQQVRAAPLRRTQQRDFFKRDLERLRTDPLLAANPSDALTEVPDTGLFVVALALAMGRLVETEGEIRVDAEQSESPTKFSEALESVWAGLPLVRGWNPVDGWVPPESPSTPHLSLQHLALVALGRLPENHWVSPRDLQDELVVLHPYWRDRPTREAGLETFLLGIAYPARILQAAKDSAGKFRVRLSSYGRWLLRFTDTVSEPVPYPQTLLVQPNLEILAYRQGLSPELIEKLSRFARWKGLGPACTLQLEPESVYHALEAGDSFDRIVQTLERHGMKALPTAVLDSLRTWSNKRDRISVYHSAALFEFATPAEMQDAISRGVPATPITDRLAVVASEQGIDYRHFRLTGTRDYLLPPEKCVDVEADGVTLTIDLARSDLLLDTEVQRFADAVPENRTPGRRFYRLTPASMQRARQNGVSLEILERWFEQRTGLPISPAAKLLWQSPEVPPLEFRRQLVLHVPTMDLADGLQQWPGTRSLVLSRLGPTALVVEESSLDVLRERLTELGAESRFES